MAETNATHFKTDAEKCELVIMRTFHAPRELVYRVWTEADHLARWWGPAGMELSVARLDVRPGGMFLFSMSAPDGFRMWGKFVYHEVNAPERIVYVNSFADEEGNTIRAPFSEMWPLEVSNTVTFAENDGATTVTLRGGPVNATAEERAAFVGMFDSMKEGFGGTFEQLAQYLAQQA